MPESSRRKLRSLVTKIRTEVKDARKLKAEGNLSPDVALCPVGVMCGRRPHCKRNLTFGSRSGASHVSGLFARF